MRTMLELCAGSGDLTTTFRARGWTAHSMDIDPARPVDVIGDVCRLPIRGHFRFLWASPPCTQFAPFRWGKGVGQPDMTIVKACIAATELADGWIIENVRGATQWFRPLLGPPMTLIGPWYLWSNLPINFHLPATVNKGTMRGPSANKRIRKLARMHPLAVEAIADAVNGWLA